MWDSETIKIHINAWNMFADIEEEDDELRNAAILGILDSLTNERRDRIPRQEGFVERLIPQFSAAEFKSHFRMLPETFEYVLGEIGPSLHTIADGSEMISAKKQLLIALWRMATPDSYRSIIRRFDVSQATAMRAVRHVIWALTGKATKFIHWPTGNRVPLIVQGFARRNGFPNVLGAIDGTHIKIRAPEEAPLAYYNRVNNSYSMQLQAICDDKGMFIHCYTENAGSVPDAQFFRLSSVHQFIDDPEKFPNDTHIIGDAAYDLHTSLLTPYSDDDHLTAREQHYNFCHSSTRMTIEIALGLLKGRWRSLLHTLDIKRTDLIPYHIMACCVLHNICRSRRDLLENFAICRTSNDGSTSRAASTERQPQQRQNSAAGVAKRNRICAELEMRED